MKIHFIGIGGIGVSALAQYHLAKGHKVSGSDLVSSEVTELLEKKGADIFIGKHSDDNLKEIDLVVYSPAVSSDNPELKKAKELNIKTQSYPEVLGDLTKEYYTIAVSGTHGKSTTTAMLSLILIEAGLDPTVIIGTKLKEFGGTNFRAGDSKYLVIEADEWNASFLNYSPKIIVLTNIEKEHLDYYKDLNHILKIYREYISKLPEDGILITNKEDKNSQEFEAEKYSIEQSEVEELKKILQVPGDHNMHNALAALTAARALKIPDETSFKALSKYTGAWRRFEIIDGKIDDKKITVISDYAHHPTEVKAFLESINEKYPGKNIWCVFQPHQHQRTFYLFDDFIKVFFKTSINVIITDIYDVAGREQEKISQDVSSKKLVERINNPNVRFLEKNQIKGDLKQNLKEGDILIIMGAGDIYMLVNEFST